MREIVLDTETTGLDPSEGHRLVEIACVELFNHIPTGAHFHKYVNPERDMPDEAFAVHGLSAEFLSEHPLFDAVVDEFLAFIGNDRLIIHNAEFDLKFLNAELKRCGKPKIACPVEDTLLMARRRFPGAQASLDALCRRFEIDLSARSKHGALLDGELLAAVYLELLGGRQPDLALATAAAEAARTVVERVLRPARPHGPTEAELEAHAAFMKKLKEPLWLAEG